MTEYLDWMNQQNEKFAKYSSRKFKWITFWTAFPCPKKICESIHPTEYLWAFIGDIFNAFTLYLGFLWPKIVTRYKYKVYIFFVDRRKEKEWRVEWTTLLEPTHPSRLFYVNAEFGRRPIGFLSAVVWKIHA